MKNYKHLDRPIEPERISRGKPLKETKGDWAWFELYFIVKIDR